MKKGLRRGVGGGCAAALCLLAALARAADWPAYQFDPQHSAFSPDARLRLPLGSAWSATLGGEGWGTSGAVLAMDAVYAATLQGEVIAFDRRTGAERWRHAAGGSIYLVPAVSEGRLTFGSAAGALVALEAATGAVLWSYETGSNINASPNVAGGVVYFASNDGYAYALEADTGRLKWRRELGGYLLSSPALDADRVYLGTLSGRLVALNRADGSPAWESAVGSPLRGAPSVSQGLVYIGAADGVLRAFHAGTGAAAWSHAAGAAIFDGLAVSSTSVFIASVDGTLQALAKADGAPRWSFTAGTGVHAAPSLAGDALVLGGDDGTLYVLGTATGGVRQSLALAGRIAAPAALGNGQAYVLTDAGRLYALQSPNVAPLAAADLRVNGGTTPVNSQTLAFSWTFRDPDAEDAPSAFQVQVTSTSFEDPVLDSGVVFGPVSSYAAAGPLPEGSYRWRVQTYDALGASSPFTTGADSFLIDRTRPEIALTAPLGGEVFIGERGEIEVSFAVTDDKDPAPRSEAWLVQTEDRGSPRGIRPERVAVTSGQRLPPFDLDDGLWTLQVSATDFASNASTAASGAFEVVHDTLPPRSTLAFGEPNFADAERGVVYVASRTVLTLTSSDDLTQTGDGVGLGVADQTVLLDGASYFAFVRPTGSTQTVLASTFPVLGADGVKDLRYGARDVLGHAETLQSSRIGLDDTAPVLSYAVSREPVVRSSASGAWFPGDFSVVWTATDTGSGLAFVSPASSVTVEGRDIAVSGSAVDRLGHEARASVSVNMDKTAPSVRAGADVEVTEGSSVTFAGTVSDNLDEAPAFAWLFSDGGVAAGESAPTAFYPDEGEFTAVLVSTDHAGHVASSSVTVRVANAAPRLEAGGDRVIQEGERLILSVGFTDPGLLDSHTASVDWGDGQSATMTVTEAGGAGSASAEHTYGDDGLYLAQVTVRDEDGGVSTASVRVIIGNVAPVLAALADQEALEGSTVTLLGAAYTDAGLLDTHTATVDWGDGTAESATVSSLTVLAQHVYGDNGSYAVKVTVNDDDGGTVTSTFTAKVSNVAPTLAALANQSADEGSPVSLLGAIFTDAGVLDTHTATVDWGDGTAVAAAISSKTISAQHAYDDNGAYTVTVTVVDDDGGTAARTFTATVANVAPTLAALADRSAAEGSVVSLQGATFTDPGFQDTHSATVNWGDGTSEAAVVSSHAVTASHAYGDNGSYGVTVTVTDDDGGTSAQGFTATVSNVAPVLAALTAQSAAEGALVNLQGATFTDPGFLDTHTATVDWGDGTAEPATVSSMTVLARHVYGDNGTYSVKVTVSDDDGGVSARAFTARVGNAAPSLAALADQSASEGSLMSLQGAIFTDPGFLDSHTATVDWGDGTAAPASVSSKTVSAQHVYGDDGAFTVTVTVADDDGGTSVKTFTATVGNVAPSLAALAGQSAAEGSTVSLQGATFTDPGFLDTHTAAIDWGDGTTEAGTVSSKTVSGQHAYGDNGAYTVTVTVTDDDRGAVSRQFTATVGNVAPSLAALDGRSVNEGALLPLQGAVFTDPGFGDTHTATVDWGDGATETAAISSKTVQARHAYGDNGTYTVTVRVTDDDGGLSTGSFTATVANVAPSLAALSDQSAAEGSLIGLQGAVFTDPGFLDSHTGSVDWGDGTTTPAVISSKTLQASHAYGDNGAYLVTVTVADDDGGASAKTFTATVSNAAPALAALADQSAVEGTFIALQGATFTDAGFLDSHTAAVNWGDGTSGAAGVSSKTVSAQHAYGDNGSYVVTVTVTDDDGGSAARTFTATIANAAPTLAALPDQGAQEGSFIQLPPAVFADAGYRDSHNATVDWGDGTTEPAGDIAVTATAGSQGTATSGTVQARHAYGDNGVFTAMVTVADDDGAISSSSFKVTVSNALPTLAVLPDVTAAEGTFVQLPPAAFADAGYLDLHTASIDWGDGTTEPATDIVLVRSAGQEGAATAGTVLARHAYADNGVFTAQVTVRDDDGGSATTPMKVTVSNVAPAVAAMPDALSGAGGAVYVGGQIPVRIFQAYSYGTLASYAMGPNVVQTFAPAVYSDPGFDNPPGGTREDFTASVAWGDGQTTTGVSVEEVPGAEGLSTVGRAYGAVHQYAANGVYNVTVSVSDDDAGAGSRAFSVTVDREPPVTSVGYIGPYLLASAAPAAVPPTADVFLRSTSDIVLSAEDPRVNDVASGVQRTFWREGQFAPFVLYTGPFRTPGAGSHIVEYFSVDERGNEEPHKLLRIGVDDSGPASSVSYGTAAAQAFGLPLLTPSTPVTLSAADLEAAGVAVGVERISYRLDGGPELAYAAPFTIPSQGMHVLEFGSFDRLTNAEVRQTVRFAVGVFQTAALWGTEGVDGSGTADVIGTVLSNATVTLSGSVLVSGDVLAGTATLKGQAQVLGTVSRGRTPLLAEPVDLAAVAQLAAATSSNALIPPDLMVGGALVMGSGRSLTLTTGTYVLKGLRLNGGASLVVDGRVDLLIDGEVEVNGDAGVNAAGRSERLTVFVSSDLPVSFLGGAKFVGTVYAPRAELKVAGNARAAGSLGGRFVTLSGTGNIATNSPTLPPAPSSGGKGPKVASLAGAGFEPAAGEGDAAFYLRDLYVFPNPAVGGARPTIHLAVGLADKVTIRIYDVSGQDVHLATLDAPPSIIDDGSGPKYAYEYPWNGHIPSGVYLYTVVAEKSGQAAVRKAGKFAVVR